MQDRIPTKPNRWSMKDVATQETTLVELTRADEPTQEGTPLNKNSFLKDATAALFGLTSAAVPDDVLATIASGFAKIETGSYTGTGVYGTSNKNSITFSITPKIVLIVAASGTQMYTPYIFGGGAFSTGTKATNYQQIVTVNRKTMEWYSDGGNAGYQLNTSGVVYTYCAIGV